MESLVDEIIDVDYSDLDESISKFPINKRFGLVVHLNSDKYEFLLNLKESSDAVLVLAPPAIEGEHLKKFHSRPYFSRQSWDFKESTIYFEDPTRYVYSLKSGWGIGTPNEWFLNNIKKIILKITHFFNIPNEKLIFFGSSSGGFTSIQLATLVKDSLAIADCPQTDLRKWRYYWKDLKRTIFNQFSDEEIDSIFSYRVSVIDNMIRENYVPNLLFISTLNENDIASQTVPFIQQLNSLPFENNSFSRIKIFINPVDFHGPIYKFNAFKLLEDIEFFRNKEKILYEFKRSTESNNLSENNDDVLDCMFYDGGITGASNTNWIVAQGMGKKIVTSNGTVLSNNDAARYDIFTNKGTTVNVYDWNAPFVIEVDITSHTGNPRLQIYSNETKEAFNGISSVGHWKITYDGTTVISQKNNERSFTYIRHMPNARIGFYVPQYHSITYKNLRIYPFP